MTVGDGRREGNLYLELLLLSHGQRKTHLGDFDCVLRTTENLFLPSVLTEARGALVGKTALSVSLTRKQISKKAIARLGSVF